MAKRKVTLTYPQDLVREPVLFQMARQFEVIPNIRRAKVTETVGEMVVELEGEAANLEHALQHLQALGIIVTPVEGDLIEP